MSNVVVPKFAYEAFNSLLFKWKNAIMEGIRELEKYETWELVKLPKGKYHVGCKWDFTIKHKPNGMVDRFKSRLVAK